jgi:NADP-dependent 3-hydroxy acid dehydrogenase YdfG
MLLKSYKYPYFLRFQPLKKIIYRLLFYISTTKRYIMGKVIAITGASSGFGLAMAEKFNKENANLILVARNSKKLEKIIKMLNKSGGNAIAVVGDVTKSETFKNVLQVAIEKFGKLDVLINNAGGGVKIGPIEDMDDTSIQDCLDLNLSSVIKACRTIVPQMKKQGNGLIINLTSACAKFAWPEWSVYSAAKTGLSMLSRCLHAELRPYGIAVSVIVPGGSNTSFQQHAGISKFDWNEQNALRPEHIANAASSIVNQPSGAVIPEMVVYGMEQDVIPF